MDPTQIKKIQAMNRVFFLVYMSNLIAVLLSSKLLFIIGNLIIFVLIVNSRILSSDSSSTSDVYYDEYIQSSQTKTKPLIPNPEVNTFENVEDGQNIVELKGKGWDKKGTAKEEENLDGGDEQSLTPPSDELNKRADDFIARVNRQRRIELSLLKCGSY
ncbi:hypothetical protein SESBI_20918 [Sesbania bispinosa]|nr:hypothetical protein SESBI_20918 [Sesbania bispinosa]